LKAAICSAFKAHPAAQALQTPVTSSTWARGENCASLAGALRLPRSAPESASTTAPQESQIRKAIAAAAGVATRPGRELHVLFRALRLESGQAETHPTRSFNLSRGNGWFGSWREELAASISRQHRLNKRNS
jgi:hypothetical protein